MARPSGKAAWRGRLFAIAAIYLTIFGVPQLATRQAWQLTLSHVALTLLLAAWLVWLLRRGEGWPRSPLDAPLAALFGAYAIGTVFAVDPRVSAEGLWLLGVHILLFYAALSVMRVYRPRAVLEPVLLAAGVVVVIGVVEFAAWYFGWPLLPQFRQGWPSIGGLRQPFPPAIYRLQLTLSVPTILSAYLALLIPVGLAWAVATRHRDTRQGLALWLAGALLVEGLSFSRGGLLSLAVSLPAFAALVVLGTDRGRGAVRRLLRGWQGMAIVTVVLVLAAAVGYGWLSQDHGGHRSGDVQRLDMWRSAWEIGLDRPLMGVGAQGFGRALRSYRNPLTTNDNMFTPNNGPLLIWSEGGLLAAAAFAWFAASLALMAWRRWRSAAGAERIRVAGAIAGLLGFGAQNVVDNFAITATLLPALALMAYLALPEPERAPAGRVRRAAPAVVLGLVLLAGVGWALADAAAFAYTRALKQADTGDLEGALDSLARARRLDPGFGLYAAQVAQFTGEQAVRGDAPVEDALAAYEEAFGYEATSDEMRASYAMLLAEAGEIDAAAREMARAATIQPRSELYSLWAGALAEQTGEGAAAEMWYLAGIERSPDTLTSGFWEETALRRDVRDAALTDLGVVGVPLADLAAVPSLCWDYLADPSLEPQTAGGWACRGEVALRVDDDPAAAVAALAEAIRLDATRPGPYLARADAHRMLGDLPAAERDARIALFLGSAEAEPLLALIEAGDTQTRAADSAALDGIVDWQGYEVAVYSRRGSLRLLPLLDAP